MAVGSWSWKLGHDRPVHTDPVATGCLDFRRVDSKRVRQGYDTTDGVPVCLLSSHRAGNRAGRAGAASAGWVCTLWNDYAGGFPWHPHRGIETITYVLAGSVAHGDSLAIKEK
jgi:redox-sensitive bicupin YhaK (pirin superfamily)